MVHNQTSAELATFPSASAVLSFFPSTDPLFNVHEFKVSFLLSGLLIFINIPNVSLFLLRHSSFFIILLLNVFVNVLYTYFEKDVIFLTSFRSLSVY